MQVKRIQREGRPMRQVAAPGLSLCLDETTGRVLELIDGRTQRHLLMWRPVLLAQGRLEETGGFGPFGPIFQGAKWRFARAKESFALSATLAGGCAWRQRFRFDGPDGASAGENSCLRVDAELTNPTSDTVVEELCLALTAQPGYGGDWPRMVTACLHNRQKVTLADRKGRTQEVYPITIESVTRGFGDVDWLAVTDAPTGQGLWVQLPPGAVTLFTEKAFDFTWRCEVVLPPGRKERWTFRLAGFQGIDNPEGFAGGWLVGSVGNRLIRTGGGACQAASRHLFGHRQLPARLASPRWSPACADSSEYGELMDRFAELGRAAGADPRKAAALGSFAHRAAMLDNRRPSDQMKVMRGLAAEAERVAAAGVLYRPYYSPADLENMRRLAECFDAPAAAARAKAALAEPFRIDQPRLRHYDAARNPGSQASLGLQAACLAAVCGDAELARLAAGRLVHTFAEAWGRFGILAHETIHHGVLVSMLVPAYSLLAQLGAFDQEPEGESRVVAMLWDIVEQIHRLRRPHQSVSNWQGMEQAGITALCAVFPGHPEAPQRVEYAVGQFENLLTKGVFSDGLFWEMSLGYHQNVQMFLMAMAENLLRCGVDLLSHSLASRSMVELARHTAGMLMPDGRVPRFEDSSHAVNASLLAHYARRFNDGQLAAAAKAAGCVPGPADLRWPAPMQQAEPAEPAPAGVPQTGGCQIFPAAGRAVLRSPGGQAALAIDYGPHGGWHGDWDKLSFELFDRTGPLICDPGTYRYEEALHWSHFKHTASHSTVTLEDRRQLACCGRLVAHEQSGKLHSVTVEAETYPAARPQSPSAAIGDPVTHRRTVRHCEGGFAVEDELRGDLGAKEAVFRLTFPAPAKVEGSAVSAPRLRVELHGLTAADRLEVVEVPIMPVQTATIHDEPCATGYQLRWHRPLGPAEREVHFSCTLLPRAQ